MIILDANILIYAKIPQFPQHATIAKWVEAEYNKTEPVGVPWISIWAFMRITTNQRIWPKSVPISEIFSAARDWTTNPNTRLLHPGPRHLQLAEELVLASGMTGAKITDAVLAAITIEHDGTLASTDSDFQRFPGLRYINPLA